MCPRCLSPLEPVLWGEDAAGNPQPEAWVCRCPVAIDIRPSRSASGVVIGGQIWERAPLEAINYGS